jgi:hypothetical protein
VGRMKGKTVITPLRQVVSEDKGLPMDLLELMHRLST